MEFKHQEANRYLNWDLQNTAAIHDYLEYLYNREERNIVEHFLLQFEMYVLPVAHSLRKSIIHNDGNDHNILIQDSGNAERVIRIIDFGDMVYSFTIADLAVVLVYLIFDKENPLETAAAIIEGYNKILPLEGKELDVLFFLICARLCISVCMSAYQYKMNPNNEYLKISEKPAWNALKKLIDINPEIAKHKFRKTCGLESKQVKSINEKDLLTKRNEYLGSALSLSYKKPLKIVRGFGQYLYDEKGDRYLDCVNNVCHVGHCHPRVVRAAQNQIAVLNTNTRYLHDTIVEYAEKLLSKFPPKLNVCYFVCSGSEANELALRMAKTHTGRKDFIVIDNAYHGNTTTLVDISPYKFDGPGGKGVPDYVHKVEMPDLFRGSFRSDDPAAGKNYANNVKDVIQYVHSKEKSIAAFICESLPGVGGQIVLPEGYLTEAYKYVRNAGGICIADEVQVGFGRVGTHFWGFETQGVVPDIVTLGKPIGNGHPLAAVITTREIAESFDTGMEYFNTFGGNPVSCAVGLEVLNVIEEEDLQSNALNVGNYLREGLKDLQARHNIIGDVRGLGLFIGIELVKDRNTLEPAENEAVYIIEQMKEKGILLSIDGPLHNVLKIKPPIVFNKENADKFINTFDNVLKSLT